MDFVVPPIDREFTAPPINREFTVPPINREFTAPPINREFTVPSVTNKETAMPTLGRRAHIAGNKIRYSIDFNNFLEGADATLTSATVVLAAPVADVTISGVVVVPSGHLVFFLAGGSNSEIFTVNVAGIDSRGEVKNDTIEFYIVAP